MEKTTTARILSVSTAWNLAGYIVPLAIGVITIPRLIHGLGVERFGVLTLAWVLIGAFSIFDFGLGRALTQVVATALGRGAVAEVAPIVWSSLLLMFVSGVVGAGIVAAREIIAGGLLAEIENYLAGCMTTCSTRWHIKTPNTN